MFAGGGVTAVDGSVEAAAFAVLLAAVLFDPTALERAFCKIFELGEGAAGTPGTGATANGGVTGVVIDVLAGTAAPGTGGTAGAAVAAGTGIGTVKTG